MLTRTTLQIQLRRLGWLLLIWALSVLTLGVVASLFRALMTLARLTV
jgi:uncharacterized protein DUF2474